MNNKINLIMAIALAVVLNTIVAHQAFGTTKEQKASDVAWADGCSDAATGTSNAYNGHSNASHHSATYIGTYQLALAQCNQPTQTNVNSQNTADNSNQNNRNQAQSQTATAAQHCFVLIGNCSGANVNQGADLTN